MPGHRRVVVVEAAARRARAEGQDPLRLHHLLVDALEHRRLALADGPDDPEQVALARREARRLGAEAREVEPRARERHELHPAARGHERIGEERVLAGPAEQRVDLGRREPVLAPLERQRRDSRLPFERSLPPDVDQRHDDDREEAEHLHEARTTRGRGSGWPTGRRRRPRCRRRRRGSPSGRT